MKKESKNMFTIKPVKAKDIAGAGLTLSVGYLVGPLIPFKKLKNWRFGELKNGKTNR